MSDALATIKESISQTKEAQEMCRETIDMVNICLKEIVRLKKENESLKRKLLKKGCY